MNSVLDAFVKSILTDRRLDASPAKASTYVFFHRTFDFIEFLVHSLFGAFSFAIFLTFTLKDLTTQFIDKCSRTRISCRQGPCRVRFERSKNHLLFIEDPIHTLTQGRNLVQRTTVFNRRKRLSYLKFQFLVPLSTGSIGLLLTIENITKSVRHLFHFAL